MPAKFEEVRIPKHLQVKVRGVDRFGNTFTQTASTLDISRHGARLDGLGCVANSQTIEVSCGWFNKAQFKVVWTGKPGTSEATQIGIRALDQQVNLWGLQFPPARPSGYQEFAKQPAAAPPVESGPIKVGLENITYGDKPPDFSMDSAPQPVAAPAAEKPRSKTVISHTAAIMLRWKSSGLKLEESVPNARILNDKSCMLQLRGGIKEGTTVEVINQLTNESRTGKVIMSSPAGGDGMHSVAVDFD